MSERIRLLLVTDAVGGVWVYSLELARALSLIGIDTVLAVMGPSPTQQQREQAEGIKLIDTGLPLDWLETSASELKRAGAALADIARIEGVDVVQVNSAALLADCPFDQPSVSVQHSCVASWWAAVRGTPLPRDFLWRRELTQAGLNQAAAVVAPTIAFAAETARIYDINAPVVAVYNGRRAAFPTKLEQSDFVFTASRLWDEGKNVATLDAAAAQINFLFEAAGPMDGPNGASIALNHLHSLGEVSSARLQNILAARPIFASAAIYEPFGLSVLEAGLAGCALVLSDIPTYRELWGEAAVFVAARDDAAFATAIEKLFEDPDERQRLGRLAQGRAQLYAPERMAGAMAEIYQRISRSHFTPVEIAGAA